MLAVTNLIFFFALTTIDAIYQTKERARRLGGQERSGCVLFFF